MGREIRRVPVGWEHPKHSEYSYSEQRYRNVFRPLFDRAYEDALEEWVEGYGQWKAGTHPDQKEGETFWGWEGGPPRPEYYRPKWTPEQLERMGYCIYETVSEGTPTSPTFETKPELVEWLVEQGRSRVAAEKFVESGWAPSMIISGGKIYKGIDAAETFNS